MNVEKLYGKIKLSTCKCKSGIKLFDPLRNIFVFITPEEKVRQKTCLIMHNNFGVPKEFMRVEEHLVHYGVKNINGRMDILITFLDNSGNEKPLAVIECKENRVPVIAEQVKEQARNYAISIKAEYFILTNGIEMYYYHYNLNSNKYELVDGLLSYSDMLSGNGFVAKDTYLFERLEYEDYSNVEMLRECEWGWQKIGEDTEDRLIPAIINIDDCLLDISVKLKNIPSKKYEVIDDLGTQYRNYNDASGGGFGSGVYRVIRVRDKDTRIEFIVGFTIITTGKMINDEKYGTSDGKSVLVIIKNDGEYDEMAVQINLNKCLNVKENYVMILHNALITRKGKTKKDLLEFVKKKNQKLVKGNMIILGELNCNKSLYINSPDVSRFISNAIEYAVYRDEYKNN